jgi:hypothetical protein
VDETEIRLLVSKGSERNKETRTSMYELKSSVKQASCHIIYR